MSEPKFKDIELSANLAAVPGLKERVMAAIPVIAETLNASADRISLKIFLQEGSNDPWVLIMEIRDDLFGRTGLLLPQSVFARGNAELRKAVRSAHSEILEQYMHKQVEIYKKRLAEPVEAS